MSYVDTNRGWICKRGETQGFKPVFNKPLNSRHVNREITLIDKWLVLDVLPLTMDGITLTVDCLTSRVNLWI